MDSRLLAGAYSKRYKYIEREHIEALKNATDGEKVDVLAKARRLSQETNRRRKQLAQKRKSEAAREEKRRQEILNRRHQEQQQATEKYQRYNVPTRPPHHPRHSPRRYGHGKGHNTALDQALRIVRGSSNSSLQHTYQSSRNPLEQSYIKNSYSHSGGSGEGHNGHHRPQSATLRVGESGHTELMERSLRNLTSSRSRFEQQLEQHQQLLIEQQQKSLHEFNEAIRREIDTDVNVQGTKEDPRDDDSFSSASLSSVDSLEHGTVSPLSGSLPEQQAKEDFASAMSQKGDRVFERTGVRQVGQEQPGKERVNYGQAFGEEATRSVQGVPSAITSNGYREPGTNARGTSHIVGPIPHSHSSPMPDSQPPSTQAANTHSSQYQDSLEASRSDAHRASRSHMDTHDGLQRQVAVGTALRLPQQPAASQAQPIKQAAPALQYSSDLLAHRKFEPRPYQPGLVVPPVSNAGDARSGVTRQQEQYISINNNSNVTQGLDTPDGYSLPERPKAHVYAWTSPLPEDQEMVPHPSPATGEASTPSSQAAATYAAGIAADRVIATKVNPQSSRNTATAATTTCVYQTVNSTLVHNRGATYSQAGLNSAATHQSLTANVSSNHQSNSNSGNRSKPQISYSTAPQPSYGPVSQVEIPRGQGQKPGTVTTSMAGQSQAGTKLGSGGVPPSFTDASSYQHYRYTDKEAKAAHTQQNGSIAKGTLGLVNGRLTMLDHTEAEPTKEKKVVIVEDTTKEVRGILKRVAKGQDGRIGGVKGTQSKFNVHDSVEIARKHKQQAEAKQKMRKKAVRFADLHYDEEVEEDTDSNDSMTDAKIAAETKTNTQTNTQENKKPAQETPPQPKPRPASAKVISMTPKATDTRSKAPRVASAGPTRNPPAARPKAAAHIIMSGENFNHLNHHNTRTMEATTNGITVHKSQLDKKVMLINNNFMSRIPMYTGATTSTTATYSNNTPVSNTTAAVYTVTQDRPTTSTQATSTVNTLQRNGFSKMSLAGGDHGRAASSKATVVPTIHNVTILPSHSHFSNANNNSYKAVYNENGLRIDRTPTDDEINNLWQNMRTILEMGGGEKGAPPSAADAAVSSNHSDHQTQSRQTVHLSNKYIDGDSLGFPNATNRVASASAYTRTTPSSASQAAQQKSNGQQKNGYLQRYSLLQQRRNPNGMGSTARTTGVVEQTLHPMPSSSNAQEPRYAQVNTSGYAPREEMSESMAGFLAAEQEVQAHGGAVSDSRVMAAMDNAQQQQETYNSIRQKYAKGGPAALSMEEQRLLESLDRLNDRLKGVENRAPSNQPTAFGGVQPGHQVYVHSTGFRGHQIRGSQRRPSAGIRPTSARLLNRHHY